jgi:hypothetical protein
MNFGNEFWLILCQEYINLKLFAASTYLWGPLESSFDGPVTDHLLHMQGPEFKSRVFFHEDILGCLCSNLVFLNSFWDLVVPDRIS